MIFVASSIQCDVICYWEFAAIELFQSQRKNIAQHRRPVRHQLIYHSLHINQFITLKVYQQLKLTILYKKDTFINFRLIDAQKTYCRFRFETWPTVRNRPHYISKLKSKNILHRGPCTRDKNVRFKMSPCNHLYNVYFSHCLYINTSHIRFRSEKKR